ncbi:MAG TPA: SRPBCC family protein [Solirubrobacterales bacterium]|nr:SRPBCC family protein [Solirubrobacterales bacterium]
MASFEFVRDVAAPAEVVFDVLTDHRGYARITRLPRAELEREGDPAPNGVGAIRALWSVGPPLREEVIVYERPSRFSYKILSGVPVRDHVGTVELSRVGGGTHIVYVVRMMPTVPIGGGAVVAVTKLAIRQLLDGVTAEAERRAPVGG